MIIAQSALEAILATDNVHHTAYIIMVINTIWSSECHWSWYQGYHQMTVEFPGLR